MITIITPVASRRLTTIPMAADHLQIGYDVDEIFIGDLIDGASASIASYCRREFGLETVAETFRCPTGEALVLSRLPIASDLSIIQDGVALPPDEFEFDRAAGLVYRRGGYHQLHWAGFRVVATYTAGWTLPGPPSRNLPFDIEQACLILAAARFAGRGRDPLLRSEMTEGVGSSSWLDPRAGMEALPPQVAGLLEPYRQYAVG